MTFHDFFYAEHTLAMVITVGEYKKSKANSKELLY